jgi:glycosyltransferase involved in cell wall biosynthesis
MSTPLLSIVNCTRNGGAMFRQALDSVCTQSSPPDEFILLDDASEDGTHAVMQEYAARYPFIRVMRNPTRVGLNGNLGILLDTARGDFFASIAHDDWYLPGYFEEVRRQFQRFPNVGIIFGRNRYADESGNLLPRSVIGSLANISNGTYFAPERFLKEYLEVEPPHASSSPSVVYRLSHLRAVGGFRPVLGHWADEFSIRAIALRWGACFITQDCTVFRIRHDSYHKSQWRNPHLLLEILSRSVQLMRSEEFRPWFPEHHVRRWEASYRAIIIGHCAFLPHRYSDAAVAYKECLSRFRGWRYVVGRILMKLTSGCVRAQVGWMRRCLKSYTCDSKEPHV